MNVPIDISGTLLHTERLTLRPWREADLQDFYEYASVDGVGQMAGWLPHDSIETSRSILSRFIAGKKTFALELEGKVIGSLGIEEYDDGRFPELKELRCRELGFVLSKDYWGQGLMAEAVKKVLEHLFTEYKLDAVLCGHFLSNRQSERVQIKCGFEHYAYGKYTTRFGTVEDDEQRILTREKWLDP